jgi:hypothetical protein
MKTIFNTILIAVLFASFTANGQQKTALHSNGVTTIFDGASQFTDAYNVANNGDTIYLPGGLITIPAINKQINVFGAGFHPDSTAATLQTTISSLTIQENADSSFFTGINFTGGISTPTNHSVNYLTITRCSFGSITFNGNQTNPCTNIILKENIIRGNAVFSNVQYSTISNNIFENEIHGGLYNAFLNNILLYTGNNGTFQYVDNSMVSNNIVFKATGAYPVAWGCDNSTFSNNIFAVTISAGTNTLVNNFFNVDLSTVFVNQTGVVFDFTNDYHLSSPATYQGTDATEVGIFGGLYPFKIGTLPKNPHIRTKSIATQTAPNGDLNIQIKVAAQNN